MIQAQVNNADQYFIVGTYCFQVLTEKYRLIFPQEIFTLSVFTFFNFASLNCVTLNYISAQGTQVAINEFATLTQAYRSATQSS